ncbi:TIGR00730 family Rossman fold protein [Dactylosporangium siamense]|uniref:LOG family protein n=1 Tax=Dactylosporangium siamense TaxID=685454 RepID=UPI001940DB1E|nr:TIGR00730 family Rossman fold protein [Dactylosporangium siamense]
MRVTVFASASAQAPDRFVHAATAFGRDLATAGVGLVYGGGKTGLMGAVADGALSAGGEVVGVMPQSLVDAEIAHPGLSSLRIVGSLHERKAALADLGDGFAALPGGAGTLEELFEAWTWQQLGLHTKPVALLNIDDYWNPLLHALDQMTETGFVRPADRQSLIVASDAAELLTAVATFVPPPGKYDRSARTGTS